MKRTILAAGLFVALALLSPFPALAFGDKTIYGNDDRVDYFRAMSREKELSDSVVSLWRSHRIRFDKETGSYQLNTQVLGEEYYLNENEPFREQPSGSFCSGALVGEDLVMTAGHCIPTEYMCKGTKFVFGYAIKEKGGNAPAEIPAEEVYSCEKLITQIEPMSTPLNPTGATPENPTCKDYALLKLDRKVKGHRPLPINRKNDIKKGDSVLIIGHPLGLPLKIAGNSSVRDASPESHFVADLDTYTGNSGSPVFNAKTLKIEGILVRGDKNFVRDADGLQFSYTVPQDGGLGDDVTRISLIAPFIPEIPAEHVEMEKIVIQGLGYMPESIQEMFINFPH